MMKSIEENLRDSESKSETKKVLENINQDFQEVLEYNMNNLYKQSSIKIEEE